MTQTHLTRWIEAADERRVCEAALFERAMPDRSSMRVRLHSAFATMQSSLQAFVADHYSIVVGVPAWVASRQILNPRATMRGLADTHPL